MKTRKLRLLSALLALAMLLALLPTAAFAETYTDGTVSFQYSVSDGKVTITKYIGSGGNVEIPAEIGGKPVTDIRYSAFYQCSSVTDVAIPEGVTSIGARAFQECTNLKNVTFPSSIETIEKWAFRGCVALESVDLSHLNDLEQIGNLAFDNCAALKTVKLPQNGKLNTIGADAFSFTNGQPAPQITEITIPASVTTIGNGAFEGCSKLKKVTFAPNSQLKMVGEKTFDRCHDNLIICYSNKEVKQALTGAGVSADRIKPTKPTVTFDFDNGTEAENKQVENGKKVTPPTAPTRYGWDFVGWYTKDASGNWADEAFNFDTTITEDITLYARWTVGGDCGDNLTWTLDSDGTLTISGMGAMADYDNADKQPWANQRSSINKVVIGDGVTSIGENAFANCPGLKAVELPPNGVLETIKYNAFSWVHSSSEVSAGITEITIPKSVITIEKYAFDGCTKLATVTFAPNSKLETIGHWAFEDTAISEISIPASVKTIGNSVFNKCLNLTKVIFESPSSLENVSSNTFVGCSNATIYGDDNVMSKLNGKVDADKIKPANPTVTFISNGGSDVKPATVKNGEKISAPDAPTREGWNFAGWYTKDESGKWADEAFNFNTPITDNMILYARWGVKATPIVPATQLYPITIDYGTAYDADHNAITKAAAGETVYVEASETALDGMTFERWEVRKGEVQLENDRAAETSFTMPDGMVQLEAMYQAADSNDSGWDAATVVTGVAVGTGTAILAYHIGMEVYAEQVLGKDVAVPRTRAEVALLAWQLAGSPAVHVEGEPLSEAAQAEKWAVESGLMQPDAEGNFNGTKKMSKWNALRTLDAAKKMG